MTSAQADDGSRTGLAGGSHPRIWGILGVIAQVAFMAGWLVAETWQGPRYSVVTDTISDLQAATAPHAWFPIACFAAGGIGTFCLAVFGLRPALASAGRAAAHAPWMLALAGLAIGNSFPLIPCGLSAPGCTAHQQLYSPGGMTDAIVATIAFLVLAFTPGPLWERLKVLPEWQRLRPVMTTARIVCPLCFLLLSVASLTGTAEGLAERILATSLVLWIGSLAFTLTRVSGRARPGTARGNGQMATENSAAMAAGASAKSPAALHCGSLKSHPHRISRRKTSRTGRPE